MRAGFGGSRNEATSLALGKRQLARRQHDILDRHVAPPLGADDRGLGAGRDQGRHAVGGRRTVAQVAAHGGAALDLGGADQVGRLDDARPHGLELGVLLELGARHGRADAEAAPLLLDLARLGDALDVHHQHRLDQVGLHLHQQVGAAGQNPGVAGLRREQRDRLVERAWRLITHVRCPLMLVEGDWIEEANRMAQQSAIRQPRCGQCWVARGPGQVCEGSANAGASLTGPPTTSCAGR